MTQHDDTLYVALMRDEIRGVMDVLERCSREQFIADEILPGAAAFHFMRLAERPLKVSPHVSRPPSGDTVGGACGHTKSH